MPTSHMLRGSLVLRKEYDEKCPKFGAWHAFTIKTQTSQTTQSCQRKPKTTATLNQKNPHVIPNIDDSPLEKPPKSSETKNPNLTWGFLWYQLVRIGGLFLVRKRVLCLASIGSIQPYSAPNVSHVYNLACKWSYAALPLCRGAPLGC